MDDFKQLTLNTFLYGSILFALSACGGGGGTSSATPTNTPSTTQNGGDKTTAVRTSISTISSCTNGGITVEMGIDDNGNSQLDDSEVDSTSDVCNGADGRDALISLATLGAGATCAAGGILVESGPDLNTDGSLQSDEITATSPICNGAGGSSSQTSIAYIIDLSTEASSVNCPNGGTRIDSGNDLNLDTTLSNNEIISTAYVCNGVATIENTAPIVPASTNYGIAVNETLAATLSANDAESDRLDFVVAQQPLYGQISEFNAMTGAYIYEPSLNYVGEDSFQYRADDGRSTSAVSTIIFDISITEIPSDTFQIDTTQLSIIGNPDGVTEREFFIHGATKNNVLTANLDAPARINPNNLQAIANGDENAVLPLIKAKLTRLPVASGTTAITVSLFDGVDTVRTHGERQFSLTNTYNWVSDGTNLTITPHDTLAGNATYFITSGELAISLTLEADRANTIKVINGSELTFDIVALFENEQLDTTLNSIDFRAGAYTYKIEFDGIQAVDSYGNSFSQIEGMFQVGTSRIPAISNQSQFLVVRDGQLAQNSIQLSGSGGLDPLTFSIDNSTNPGTIDLVDESLGTVSYTPFAPNLLVSDAFSFTASDGVLTSSEARHNIFIVDDTLLNANSNLKLIYNAQSGVSSISWIDRWDDEQGFEIEKYNFDCQCWEQVGALTSSNLSGLPLVSTSSPLETTYYRVLVLLAEGEKVLSPGVLVAHVNEVPTIVLNKPEPVSGFVVLSLENASIAAQQITYSINLSQACSVRLQSNPYWLAFTCSYSTTRLEDGDHRLSARIRYQAGSYVDTTTTLSTLQVDTPPSPIDPTISSLLNVFKGSASTLTPPVSSHDIQIAPTQESSGVASVELRVNDVLQTIETSPNSFWGYKLDHCDSVDPSNYICDTSFNAYTWRIDTSIPGSYPYEYLVSANDGTTRAQTNAVFIIIPITLTSPAADDISGSSLTIEGTVGTTTNPVLITASLNTAEVQLLSTEGPDFNTSYDMSGLAAGQYILLITATDIVSGKTSTLTRTLNYTP